MIFILFNALILINTNFNIQKKNHNKNINSLINYDLKIDNTNLVVNNSNIFLIVLDGLMDPELAKIIKIVDLDKIKNLLSESEFNYSQNFISNYNVTSLSIGSLLTSTFYNNYDTNYKFPEILYSGNNQKFLEILKIVNKDFYWIGNDWKNCKPNLVIKCYNFNYLGNFLNNIKNFYYYSVYSYVLEILSKKNFNITSINFLKNFYFYERLNKTKNNFFFIHVLAPHPPGQFTEDCKNTNKANHNLNFDWNKIDHYDEYKFAYNCAIDISLNFANKVLDKEPDSIFIILGDHGWNYFDKSKMQLLKNELNIDTADVLFRTFLTTNILKKCPNLDLPKSVVNVIRFLINCTTNANLNYLTDELIR